ncbi:MAG: carbamate kinase, partial [Eubacterium sp.]
MKQKKIVIALGGNALGFNFQEQKKAVEHTAKVIGDLIEEGFQVILTHGNGPQVGMIHTAMSELSSVDPLYPPAPMSVCVGMSQGYIGYDLQNAVRTELHRRGIKKPVSSIVTQVKVNADDEAFANPSKPIGRFLTKQEARCEEKKGNHCVEDSGRGYRYVVASPKPVEIIEMEIVRTLVDAGQVVIACGGGGIP